MAEQSSLHDVFRFVQLRPRRAVNQSDAIPLKETTQLARDLKNAPDVSSREAIADSTLANTGIRSIEDVSLGAEISNAILGLRAQQNPDLKQLLKKLPGLPALQGSKKFVAALEGLSDTLLASLFAKKKLPGEITRLQDVYRAYHLGTFVEAGDEALDHFLRRPLLTSTIVSDAAPVRAATLAQATATPEDRAPITDAINELVRLERHDLLVQPTMAGRARVNSTPFSLNAAARRSVSKATTTLLASRRISLADTRLDVAVQHLYAESVTLPVRSILWPRPTITPQPGITLPPAPGPALVRLAGVADLLVVKQQIKRYEGGELAHIENVLIGETKSRSHRQLDRSEDTTLTETETTRVRETELETADRFELNREAAKTVQNDQKIGFGLSLSGKYGPTVEFSSNFSAETATSVEESTKSSSRYAKDVVNRSLERLTERTRELRSRTVIRETEETNLHELKNKTRKHVRGIYQFVDKIYEAQVFNYGIRAMFDFMIPEPASFLWYVAKHPMSLELPPAPPNLADVCEDASDITEDLAVALAATYGADVEPPPPPYLQVVGGVAHGDDNATEDDQPRGKQRIELVIPAGYQPVRAMAQVSALTDEDPIMAITIGAQSALWKPSSGDREDLGDDYALINTPTLYFALNAEPYPLSTESKLVVSIVAFETNTYSVDIVAVAARTTDEYRRWQIAAYKKIRTAYEDRVHEHEAKVNQLRSEAEAKAERENQLPFGAPPAINRQTVNAELKKHCISMITQQRYDAFDATKDDKPPYFDFAEAAAEGSYIRFFEQAFEWDQSQYVFYPYFWARKSTWIDRFSKQEVDPVFLEFLKAGSARVVVPVRPGFEQALAHFMETGKLWGGDGDPPQINSPLYVSVIDEIKERTGAPKGETPVGEPWDVRIPTALVQVRPDSDLPKWKRTAPDDWDWLPDEGK